MPFRNDPLIFWSLIVDLLNAMIVYLTSQLLYESESIASHMLCHKKIHFSTSLVFIGTTFPAPLYSVSFYLSSASAPIQHQTTLLVYALLWHLSLSLSTFL